ncbi:hypothetical protein CR513_10346, partial [Mucuna pruriens]
MVSLRENTITLNVAKTNYKEETKGYLSCTSFYCDNYSSNYLANNLTFHEKPKHIKIIYHITQEKVNTDLIFL